MHPGRFAPARSRSRAPRFARTASPIGCGQVAIPAAAPCIAFDRSHNSCRRRHSPRSAADKCRATPCKRLASPGSRRAPAHTPMAAPATPSSAAVNCVHLSVRPIAASGVRTARLRGRFVDCRRAFVVPHTSCVIGPVPFTPPIIPPCPTRDSPSPSSRVPAPASATPSRAIADYLETDGHPRWEERRLDPTK